jgi:tetratricopeptide (TPR) repeat protein
MSFKNFTAILPTVAVVWLATAQPAAALPAERVAEISKAVTVAIKTENSIGSGVIIKKAGNIYTVLTAAHVVRDASATYQITTLGDRQYSLNYRTVKFLPGADLAILEFSSPQHHRVAKIGDANKIREGVLVYVGGFPLGTVAISKSIFNFTDGKVTANSNKPLADGYSIIYTNITLPGMSGGSVLNEQGELIAIHGKGDIEKSSIASSINPNIRIKTGLNLGISANTFVPLISQAGLKLEVAKASPVAESAVIDDDLLLNVAIKVQNTDYQGALADLNRLIALNPQKAVAYYLRANINQILGNRDRILEDLNQAIQLDPQNFQAYLIRASFLQANQDSGGALADYDRIIQLNPKYSQAYLLRALIYQQRGDLVNALASYDGLIVAAPQDQLAYGNRAGLRAQLNDFPGAIADFSAIIRINPQNLEAYSNRAHFRKYSGDQLGAIADYSMILKLSTNNTRSYLARAELYKNQQDFDKALADYANILKINPNEYEAHNGRLEIFQKQKNQRGVVEALTSLIRIYPSLPAYYFLRGDAQAELRNKPQATADYQQAAQLYRQNNDASNYERMIEKIKQLP